MDARDAGRSSGPLRRLVARARPRPARSPRGATLATSTRRPGPSAARAASRARRTVTASMAVVLTAAVLVSPAPTAPAHAAAEPSAVHRVVGADRIATAIAVSQRSWPDAEQVIVATAWNFPDALAGSALSAALDAPILLSDPATLRADVSEEVRRLSPRRITVLGGSAAIDDAVVSALGSVAPVRRLAGRDRFETAAAVADEVGPSGSGDVVLALGSAPDVQRAWPDALSAASLTGTADQPPLLLTQPDRLPEATMQALTRLRHGEGRVHLLGGTSSISAEVEQQLSALGHTVHRVAGPDRYQTSLDTATTALRRHDTNPRPVVLATGATFADGLAAGALTAHLDATFVLVPPTVTDSLQATQAWLTINGFRLSEAYVLGGQDAVSDDVLAQVAAALTAPVLPLPSPIPAPDLDPAAAAAETVQQLLTATTTEDASAVLLGAAPTWGLTVRAGDGSTAAVPTGGGSQGITVGAPELQAMALAAPKQLDVSLQEIFDAASESAPETAGLPVADLVVQGIAETATAEDTALSRWAWAIVEAGRQAGQPHDLLAPGIRASEIRPTVLQLYLIQMRFSAEAYGLARKAGVDTSAAGDPRQAVPAAAAPRHPCTPSSSDANATDWDSAIRSIAFGQMWDLLAESTSFGPRVTGWVKFMPLVGVVLAYAQTALNIAVTTIEAALDPSPLERTKNTTPGAFGTLTVTVSADIDDLQLINCARSVLNRFGQDLAAPAGGPLKDVAVTAEGRARDEQKIRFRPGQYTDAGGQRTREQGQVSWQVEGTPQRRELPPTAERFETTDPWRIGVVLEPNDVVKDSRDIIATVLGLPGSIPAIPAKLLAKTRLLTTFNEELEVYDWSRPWPTRITGTMDIKYFDTESGTFNVVAEPVEDCQGSNHCQYAIWEPQGSFTWTIGGGDDQETLTITGPPWRDSGRSTGSFIWLCAPSSDYCAHKPGFTYFWRPSDVDYLVAAHISVSGTRQIDEGTPFFGGSFAATGWSPEMATFQSSFPGNAMYQEGHQERGSIVLNFEYGNR